MIKLILIVLLIVQKVKPDLDGKVGIRINKCCEERELYEEKYCTNVSLTKETVWKPIFTSENGRTNLQVKYR